MEPPRLDDLALDVLEIIMSYSDHVDILLRARSVNRKLALAVTASVCRDFNGNSNTIVRPAVQFDNAQTSACIFLRQLNGVSGVIQRFVAVALQSTLTHFDCVLATSNLDGSHNRIAEAVTGTPVDFPNLKHLSVREPIAVRRNVPFSPRNTPKEGVDRIGTAAVLRKLEAISVAGDYLTGELIELVSNWQDARESSHDSNDECCSGGISLQRITASCAAGQAKKLLLLGSASSVVPAIPCTTSWRMSQNLRELQLSVIEQPGVHGSLAQRQLDLPLILQSLPNLTSLTFSRGAICDFSVGMKSLLGGGKLEKLILESCEVMMSPAGTASFATTGDSDDDADDRIVETETNCENWRSTALKVLELRFVYFVGRTVARCVVDSLRGARESITSVVISACRVGSNPHLTHASRGFVAESVEPLAAVLRACPHLASLRLADIGFDTGAAQALLQQQQQQQSTPSSPPATTTLWKHLARMEIVVNQELVLPPLPSLARLRLGAESQTAVGTITVPETNAVDAFYPHLTDLSISWVRLSNRFVSGAIANNGMLRRLQLDHVDVLPGSTIESWRVDPGARDRSDGAVDCCLGGCAARHVEELIVRNGTSASASHFAGFVSTLLAAGDAAVAPASVAAWKAGAVRPNVTTLVRRLLVAQAHATSATSLFVLETSTAEFDRLCEATLATAPEGASLPALRQVTLHLHDDDALRRRIHEDAAAPADDAVVDLPLQRLLSMARGLRKLQLFGPTVFDFNHGTVALDQSGPVLRETATFHALAAVSEVELSLVRLLAPRGGNSEPAEPYAASAATNSRGLYVNNASMSRLFVRHTLAAIREGWPHLIAACRPRLRRVDVVSQSSSEEAEEPEVLLASLQQQQQPESPNPSAMPKEGEASFKPPVKTAAPLLLPALQVLRFQLTSTTRSLRFAYEDPQIDPSHRSQRLNDALRVIAPGAVFQLDQPTA